MESFFTKMLEIFSEEVKKTTKMAYLQGVEDGKALATMENIEVNKAYICKNIFGKSYNTCKRYFENPDFPKKNEITGLWNKRKVIEFRDSLLAIK